jgi:hypothetical protein
LGTLNINRGIEQAIFEAKREGHIQPREVQGASDHSVPQPHTVTIYPFGELVTATPQQPGSHRPTKSMNCTIQYFPRRTGRKKLVLADLLHHQAPQLQPAHGSAGNVLASTRPGKEIWKELPAQRFKAGEDWWTRACFIS